MSKLIFYKEFPCFTCVKHTRGKVTAVTHAVISLWKSSQLILLQGTVIDIPKKTRLVLQSYCSRLCSWRNKVLINQTFRFLLTFIGGVNCSLQWKGDAGTCLKDEQDPGVPEVALVGIILHVAKASKDLQSLTHTGPGTFRAEHLPWNRVWPAASQ